MAKYSKPIIDVLYFDEEEIEAVTASALKGRYSAELMNEYFFYKQDASQTSTIRIQNVDVGIKGEQN